MKILGMLIAFTMASFASAAPAEFERFACSQSCGLTAATKDKVYAYGIDQFTITGRLDRVCRWKKMSLQGEPTCKVTTKRDFTKSENGQRCLKGIGTSERFCNAGVESQGLRKDGGKEQRGFQGWARDFDSAIEIALEQCRQYYIKTEATDYFCDLSNYHPVQTR